MDVKIWKRSLLEHLVDPAIYPFYHCHDMAEILLKFALNTNQAINYFITFVGNAQRTQSLSMIVKDFNMPVTKVGQMIYTISVCDKNVVFVLILNHLTAVTILIDIISTRKHTINNDKKHQLIDNIHCYHTSK